MIKFIHSLARLMAVSTGVIGIFTRVVLLLGVLVAGNMSVAGVSCHPLNIGHCAFPFPSDWFSKLNEAASNGASTDYADDLLPSSVLEQLPTGISPAQALSGLSGFSAVTPVYFQLPLAVNADSLPANGGNVLRVFDLGAVAPIDSLNGENLVQVPIVAHVTKVSSDDKVSDKNYFIEAWPRSRYRYGHRYLAVLTKGLRSVEGESFKVAESASEFYNDSSQEALELRQLTALLEAQGIAQGDLITLTHFTIRDQSEVMSPMRKMMATAYGTDRVFRNLNVSLVSETTLTIAGEVEIIVFKDQMGGLTPSHADQGVERFVPFLLTLPLDSGLAELPLAIWGHGGFTSKEVRHPLEQNLSLGMATIGLDYPNHGDRLDPDGLNGNGHPLGSVAPQYIAQQLGMLIQAPVDQMSLLKAVQTHLPQALDTLRADYPEIPRIDLQRVVVQGLSFGTMAGTTFAAFAPGIKGAFFENGSGGFMHMLSQSVLWPMGARDMMPSTASGADIALIIAMMQHYVDIGDGINFAHLYRDPLPGVDPKALAYVYALDDGIVINPTSEALAEIAELPLIEDVLHTKSHLGSGVSGFQNGYGIVQNESELDDVDVLSSALESMRTTLENTNTDNSFTDWFDEFPQDIDFFFLTELLDNPGSFPDLISFFQDGTVEGNSEQLRGFSIHFNSNNQRAREYERDWLCNILSIEQRFCDQPLVQPNPADEIDDIEDLVANLQTQLENPPALEDVYPKPSGGALLHTLLLMLFVQLSRVFARHASSLNKGGQ